MDTLYYVTVMRDSSVRIAAGPFGTHQAAQDQVAPARDLVLASDPWAHFYEFGVAKATPAPGRAAPTGKLNRHLNVSAK